MLAMCSLLAKEVLMLVVEVMLWRGMNGSGGEG